MALFPAYSLISDKNNDYIEDSVVDLKELDSYPDAPTELQLLASDENSEDDKPYKYIGDSSLKVSYSTDISNENFYIDCKLDYGNLRVSTLYYPGRPQYKCSGRERLQSEDSSERGSRKRRYYSRRVCDEPAAPAIAARTAALRALIAHSPQDVMLWEKYINFQEEWCGAEAALQAADEACARVSAPRLRARRLAALRSAAPPQRALERLRDMLAKEKCAIIRTELWEELLQVLPAAPDGDAAQVTAAAGASLRDTRAAPAATAAPARLLYAAAAALRSAGHWERLALLLNLLVAMNYAPATLAPPAPVLVERAERCLRAAEDAALASGLPLNAVWVRVERLRAAAHWHGTSAPDADPQRTPLPHDVAELLTPVTDDQLPALSARMLALVQVPALPGAQWAAQAVGGRAGAGAAEALLPLLEAVRVLPPAHPAAAAADPALARRVLALLLDPPHYFKDDSGFLSWVNGVWDACMSRAHGAWLTALLCWRLRWLRALLALAPGDEAVRLRSEARALLRRYNTTNSPLPFAEFARVEAGSLGAARARHVALAALRAALSDADCPQHNVLYIARILREVSSDADASKCALVCAVLNRALPTELNPPSQDDLRVALDMCEERCGTIEAELEAEEDGPGNVAAALSPGAGEWARARAVLAGMERRVALLRAAVAGAGRAAAGGGRVARYYEESAEALCAGAPRSACWARAFSHLFPDNAYLALASAGAPLWALSGAEGGAGVAGAVRTPRGPTAALAALLSPLLRAIKTDFSPTEAEALVRLARRVTGGAGGGVLWAARLEAEARAPFPRLPAALYRALDRAPGDKWLYVRGAAWCGGEAGALADALLERALRLHALPEELTPATTAIATAGLERGTDN